MKAVYQILLFVLLVGFVVGHSLVKEERNELDHLANVIQNYQRSIEDSQASLKLLTEDDRFLIYRNTFFELKNERNELQIRLNQICQSVGLEGLSGKNMLKRKQNSSLEISSVNEFNSEITNDDQMIQMVLLLRTVEQEFSKQCVSRLDWKLFNNLRWDIEECQYQISEVQYYWGVFFRQAAEYNRSIEHARQQIAAAWKRYNHVDNKPWFPREQDAAAVVSRTSSIATNSNRPLESRGGEETDGNGRSKIICLEQHNPSNGATISTQQITSNSNTLEVYQSPFSSYNSNSSVNALINPNYVFDSIQEYQRRLKRKIEREISEQSTESFTIPMKEMAVSNNSVKDAIRRGLPKGRNHLKKKAEQVAKKRREQ